MKPTEIPAVSGAELAGRLAAIEQRLGEVSEHLDALARRTRELDLLRHDVAKLKYEVEELIETR